MTAVMATSATEFGRSIRLVRRASLITLAGALVIGTACRHAGAGPTRRLDRTVITRDEMLNANYVNLYDAVAALRSIWLRPRGVDSFTNPSIVWVYIDGARVGDVSVLKEIHPRLVNTVRFYDGPSATSRWGVDNGAGVIHISTWSEGAAGLPVPDSTRRRPPPTPPSTL
jgi:hypothetical protein